MNTVVVLLLIFAYYSTQIEFNSMERCKHIKGEIIRDSSYIAEAVCIQTDRRINKP